MSESNSVSLDSRLMEKAARGISADTSWMVNSQAWKHQEEDHHHQQPTGKHRLRQDQPQAVLARAADRPKRQPGLSFPYHQQKLSCMPYRLYLTPSIIWMVRIKEGSIYRWSHKTTSFEKCLPTTSTLIVWRDNSLRVNQTQSGI